MQLSIQSMRLSGLYSALILLALLPGCYTFRSGSVPVHLHTIAIPPVEDVSGFGRGNVREDLFNTLTRNFRDDNSLRLVDPSSADSRLDVTITGIRTERLNLSGNELETVRGVVIDARATYNDNVQRRGIFKDRTFTGRAQYNIAQGTAGENQAILDALEDVSEAILAATVEDW